MIGATIRPWTLIERAVSFEIRDGDRVVVMVDKPYRLTEQAQASADAKLIVKAPELLLKGEALLEAAEHHIFGSECLSEREAFRAVLQEARGQRPANQHPSIYQEGQAHDR